MADYTWDARRRVYLDGEGRVVPRPDVRAAVDAVKESARARMRADTERLRDGEIDLPEWQVRMEAHIHRVHTATGAVAVGGRNHASQRDWGRIGSRVRAQYSYLRDFSLDLEQRLERGESVANRDVARAEQYGSPGVATFEALGRGGDLGGDRVRWERRVTNPNAKHCAPCVRYERRGWRRAGSHPGIGEKCDCGGNCDCRFDRSTSVRKPAGEE